MVQFTKAQRWFVGVWLMVVIALIALPIPVHYLRGPGGDMLIYKYQVEHVVRGIDPFDVLSGQVESGEEYYSYWHPELRTETRNKVVDGNAPWSYIYALPLLINCSDWVKWRIWGVSHISFILLLALFAANRGRRYVKDGGGLFVAAAALSIGFTATVNLGSGNHVFFVLASLVGMVVCLNRRWDILAGVCWACAMIKPQEGAILLIPLLIGKKWKTIVTAGMICIVLTFIVSCLVGKPMVDLVLEIPKIKGSTAISVKLIPQFLCDSLVQHGVSAATLQRVNMVVGASLCFWLCWLVRKSRDWLVLLAPAIFCAAFWTYMTALDRCIFGLIQCLFAERFLCAASRKERLVMIGLIAVTFGACLEPIYLCFDSLPKLGELVGVENLMELVFSATYVINVICTSIMSIGVISLCFNEYLRANRRVKLLELQGLVNSKVGR